MRPRDEEGLPELAEVLKPLLCVVPTPVVPVLVTVPVPVPVTELPRSFGLAGFNCVPAVVIGQC